MSLLSNKNVYQLNAAVQNTPVVRRSAEASNAASLSTIHAETVKSPRLASNAALAHLKAFGPRLTPAQSESIARLQEHEVSTGFDRNNMGQANEAIVRSSCANDIIALHRRASFKLV